MQHGAGVNREVYRLDAGRLPLAKGRARRAVALRLALVASLTVAVLAADATTLKAALDVTFWVALAAGALAPFALWSAGRRVRRSWNAFEMSLGADALAVAEVHKHRTTIRRVQVVAIAERRGGLWVRARVDEGRDRVHIPSDVEGYADVRARLGGWRPIAQHRTRGPVLAALLLATAVAGGSALALATHTPALVAAGLMLVSALGATAIVDVASHPALGVSLKAAVVVTAVAGPVVLWMQIAHRIG
jgi:hypothetical protein